MPRTARLEELGLPLHVIAQGMDRCFLFLDDHDRTGFVHLATRVFGQMRVEVLAWALMGNHIHLVLRSTKEPVGKGMQRVLGAYAQRFNRRHGRVGRLFRDRFRSRPVEDDLIGLIGYVILNPLRGGIVRTIDELTAYPWTSIAELVRPPAHRPPLVQRTSALALFGSNLHQAIDALRAMLALQLSEDPEGHAYSGDEPGGAGSLSKRDQVDLAVAGTLLLRLRSDRIDTVLRERESVAARRLLLERRGWTLDRVVVRSALMAGASEEFLRAGSRRRPEARARALAACFAGPYLGRTDTEVARATGVSAQAISGAKARGVDLTRSLGIHWRRFFEV